MIILDKEFQALIPPLSAEEKAQLEENIVAEGCRDALITWQGILLDGHNRYEICERLDIPYRTISIDLPDRDAAEDWIDKNQLGRRNLTPDQMSLLRGRRYNRAKKAPHRPEKGDQNDPLNPQKTADRLAKEHGVSPATIKRDGKIAAFMDEHPEEAKAVIQGEKNLKDVKKEIRRTNQITEEKKFNASGEGTATLYPVDCMQFIYKSDTQYDLLITDPPYMTDVDDIESFVNLWLIEVLKKVKDTGRAYVFIGAYPQELNAYLSKWYQNKLEYLTLENILVWTYKNTIGPSPKDKYKLNWQAVLYFKGLNAPALNTDSLIEKFTVHEINAPDGRLGDRYHTWQKPYEIAELFIRHSTQEGAAVFDPFSGTGTFLLAAKRLNRQAVGCELSADMIAIAQERGVNVA
jgi:DNA modification methylase